MCCMFNQDLGTFFVFCLSWEHFSGGVGVYTAQNRIHLLVYNYLCDFVIGRESVIVEEVVMICFYFREFWLK